MTMAKAMGLAEVVQRLLDFTDQLRNLELDMHEFIALKALILMTPGEENIRVQNDDFVEFKFKLKKKKFF